MVFDFRLFDNKLYAGERVSEVICDLISWRSITIVQTKYLQSSSLFGYYGEATEVRVGSKWLSHPRLESCDLYYRPKGEIGDEIEGSLRILWVYSI